MQSTQSWQLAHILDFMIKCACRCQLMIAKHSDDVCAKHSSSKSIQFWETQSWQVCMQNACRLHATCQNKVAQNCIWLILPSVSEPFAHFWMFFHLLHFTTPHFLCHKRLILLSSTETIVPPNRQVQKLSLSCKKPACWFIKILSNRDSKMMQDFFWKGGSTYIWWRTFETFLITSISRNQ